jgi:hypothetical protein
MKRKPDHSKFIWDLPDKSRLEYLSIGRERLVDLGAKVANFEPPYEYLRNVQAGFDAEIRFVLNRCLERDPHACAARDAFVFREKNWFKGVSLEADETAWRDFFVANNDACQAYIRANYPWRYFDPHAADPRRFERDPKLDEYFTAAVIKNLGAFGFRRLSRSFKSEVLSRPMEIKWDKGTWSLSMTVWLDVPSLAQSERIGMPFAMSAAGFEHSLAANVEKQLHAFFREYGRIFPDVLSAVEQTIKDQEAWLEAHGK